MTLKLKVWVLSAFILIGLIGMMLLGLFTLRLASTEDNNARVRQLLKSTYSTVI